MLEIVVTHEQADFDALAAAVAAQKLYPGSVIVLGRSVSASVRDFLSLHKDRFPHLRASELDQASVTRVVIVDVRRASRLSAFPELIERARRADPTLDVHVYDHHTADADDFPASLACVEPLGSATTLLVERLRAAGIGLDPVEATLCTLGIHADTGSLMFPATTSRDVQAVAWLLDRGARLHAVQRYLNPPLTLVQREALRHLLAATRIEVFGGLPVGFCAMVDDERRGGLDVVVSRALEFLGPAVLLFAHEVRGKRVDVIARSRSPQIDVGALLRHVGGGGHQGAGAAAVKHTSAEACLSTLAGALRASPPTPRLVRDVMSSPVHTVSPSTSLEELARSLDGWAHTGAPVVDERGAVVGVISRRDLRKAERSKTLHLTVRSYMSRHVRTTSAEATVEEALAELEAGDVGRLPVLSEGELVGIVTRTDLLAEMYPVGGSVAPHPW